MPACLEVSPEEQTRRLEARIDDGRKIWKLSPTHLKCYSRWFDYSRARNEMFQGNLERPRVDDEKEVAFLNDLTVLEMDFGQNAAHLSTDLNSFNCCELAEKARLTGDPLRDGKADGDGRLRWSDGYGGTRSLRPAIQGRQRAAALGIAAIALLRRLYPVGGRSKGGARHKLRGGMRVWPIPGE